MKFKEIPFIIFDGLDGSGKGTQVDLLRKRTETEKKKIVFTREPGGVAIAEALRTVIKSDVGMSADSLTQFLMFWAARNAWMRELVMPTRGKQVAVISDRGDSSTFAYQVSAKGAPELEGEFWRMRELVFRDSAPTAYIIIDVPAEEARRRSMGDGEHTSGFDVAPLEFYERVREGFVLFSKKVPTPIYFVDGMRSREEIHEEVYGLIANLCGWGQEH